ncbi:MAG: diguanylate cyclase [Nitrospirae bacterium]|nr:diguanylate cyclase [Nitrospirota bacterium]
MQVMEFLQRQSKRCIVSAGIVQVLVLGAIDYVTGSDFSFVVFYLFPVFLVTWFAGKQAGIAISLMSGIAWFVADAFTMPGAFRSVTLYLNFVTKLGFFLVVNFTISSLKVSLEREREMARTDYLTQVANSRYFAEIASNEIRRAGRYLHPFTVAYLDIDDFKSVNDRWGHSTGDQLLALVADTIRSNIRATDSIARLGGDEFALLLPETGYDAASVVIQKVHQSLQAAMGRKRWPVTFSIGVVTFRTPPDSVDGMIRVADMFMYSVKHSGKNRIQHQEIEYQAA